MIGRLFFIVLFIGAFSSCISLNKGLVAYYPFNGDAYDKSGNNNNGVIFGATFVNDRFGKPNNALYFNGVDNFVEIVPDTSKAIFGDFTLTAWVKNSGWKDQKPYDRQYIFDGHSSDKNVLGGIFKQGFMFFYDSNDTIKTVNAYILFSENNLSDVSAFSNNSNSLSNWHHIILIRKGKNIRMFYDATEVFILKGFMKSDLIDMRHTWYIGTFCGNNPNYLVGGKEFNYSFKGVIDEIRIYNRAISSKEIRYLNNQKGD
jgi:hypothetical protein